MLDRLGTVLSLHVLTALKSPAAISNRELANLLDSQPEGVADLKKRRHEVLELLIQLQLLKNEAANRGIKIDETAVQERLDQYMSQGREVFESFLAENSLTLEQFRERLREDMLIEQLGNAVRTELVEAIDIPDEDIDSYYRENRQLYDISEIAHVYIRISPPGEQEQVDAAHAKAVEAISRLERGTSFAQVVRRYSDDTSTKNAGGVLGPLNSGLFSKTFINAVVQLEAGAYTTEPLQVQDGFHIIKRLNEQYMALDDVKEFIKRDLMQRRVELAFEKWIADRRSDADVQIYL